MKKRIVIINGTGGSGKDTFVDFCKKYAKIMNTSSIDKVKEIASLAGWDGGKTDKDRKFLADLKHLTTEYNDMAFNDIKKSVKKFIDNDDEILFIHIREPEEIEKAKKEFNTITLLVKRIGLENIQTNDADKYVDNYSYDYIIYNSTLEELENDAKKFVNEIMENEANK